MHEDHPNLSTGINEAIRESELAGGIWFDQLPIGSEVKVQTRHTLYLISRRPDGDFIHGSNRFCPEPAKVTIEGSTFGGSMTKVGWIGMDMYLKFRVAGHRPITTSEIQDVALAPSRGGV